LTVSLKNNNIDIMGFFENLGIKFFNNLTNKLEKSSKDLANTYNFYYEQRDYSIAGEIVQKCKDRNLLGKTSNSYKIYLEGIFLGISDRTSAHPYLVKVIPSSTSQPLQEKLMGFPNNEVDYKEDTNFNLIDYFNTNWFPPIIDSYLEKKQELNKSKQLYQSGDISFFDYFIKRLEVYDDIQEKVHIKNYEGFDRKKYINNLRDKFRLILR